MAKEIRDIWVDIFLGYDASNTSGKRKRIPIIREEVNLSCTEQQGITKQNWDTFERELLKQFKITLMKIAKGIKNGAIT